MGKNTEASLLLRIKETGSEAISKTTELLGSMGKIATVAYAEIVAGAKWALDAWRESELATNKLNQAMVNSGVYTKELSDEYQRMAAELQKSTTFSDDAIVSAQAALQAYLGETKITKELTTAVLDLAAAKGMDLASAADLVGKSIGTSTNALSRHGIAIDETATKEERLSAVLTGIEGRWKGQAEAAAQGLGTLSQLGNSIGDIGEVIGQRLTPAVAWASNQLKIWAGELQNSKVFVDTLDSVIRFLVTSLLAAKNTIVAVGETIGASLGTATAGIAMIIDGKYKAAWEAFKQIPSQATGIVKDRYQAFVGEMAAVNEQYLSNKQEALTKEETMIAESELRKDASRAENQAIKDTQDALRREQEVLIETDHQNQLSNLTLTQQLARVNQMMATEWSATGKMALELEKRRIMTALNNEELKKSDQALQDFRKAQRDAELKDQATFLNTVSTLQSAKSAELVAIGKAAAILNIAIKTPEAVASSFAFGSMIGGPILGGIFAGIAATAMAAQAAKIAGIFPHALAEGGIVRATAGGVPAIIGEGGRDEAVIPLDSPEAAGRLGGGGVTVHFNGPILGDESQARSFAVALDRELLKLRRDGESLAFDSRIT